MWLGVLLLVLSTVYFTSSYPVPPSNDTISLANDELLLRIQPPVRQCYMQYAAAAKHIAQFASTILASSFEEFQKLADKEICICETWVPEMNPTQLYISTPEIGQNACIENELSAECDSFTESCILNFWLGDPSKNTNPTVYKSSAVLKCTADSSSHPKVGPKYVVNVVKMDEFDIGRRCNGRAIVDLLNYRMELYRVGSQYFWQIPIFNRDIFMENNVCDPRIFESLVAMRIHYKCSAVLPNSIDIEKHQKPVARTRATILPSSLHESNVCYMQKEPPWAGVMLQNFMAPILMDTASCLCEFEAGIADSVEISKMHAESDGEVNCHPKRTYKCSETGTAECTYDITLDMEDDVQFWCDGVDQNDKVNGPPNLGTEYFPNYVAKVNDVSMSVGIVFDHFTDWKQLRNCINNAYPHWWQNARDNVKVDENIREQKNAWATYINNK